MYSDTQENFSPEIRNIYVVAKKNWENMKTKYCTIQIQNIFCRHHAYAHIYLKMQFRVYYFKIDF